MAQLRTYKDLLVWQRSFDMGLSVYELTRAFPAEERYGLSAQMRRAAVSISSNIAEGYARDTTRDYLRFLWVANGSLAELETQTLFAIELRHAAAAECSALLDRIREVQTMLAALIKALKRKESGHSTARNAKHATDAAQGSRVQSLRSSDPQILRSSTRDCEQP